jgi:hypothetical protein
MSTPIRRMSVILALGPLALGCGANPEGPRVPRYYETNPAAKHQQVLPPKGAKNPRGLQYARPD